MGVVALAGTACGHREAYVLRAPAPSAESPTHVECKPAGHDSRVRIHLVGTLAPGAPADSIAAALCPRLEELENCISIVHGSAPELQGTLDVEMNFGARSLRSVEVVGGTLPKDRFGACVVDALEVTRGDFRRTIRFTLNVVAPDTRGTPVAKDGDTVGTLPPEAIKELIRAHFPRLRSCYEQRLISIPDLSGTVTVRYIIDENGAVSSADIDEATTTIRDAEMRACVRDAYRKIRYPRPVGGKVMVTYPVTFTSE